MALGGSHARAQLDCLPAPDRASIVAWPPPSPAAALSRCPRRMLARLLRRRARRHDRDPIWQSKRHQRL